MGAARSLGRVVAQLEDLLELARDPATLAASASCSGWSVAQQVEHLATVDESVADRIDEALERPASAEGGRLTALGLAVLTTGWIPRGVGRAPRSTRPSDEPVAADLERRLGVLVERYRGYGDRLGAIERSAARFRHPYFGGLRLAQWFRFVEVHHRHHQKIVADIRRVADA